MFYNIIVFFGVLFNDAHLVDFFGVFNCATVEDRQFGSIECDEAVVDTGCIESGKSVFDGADAHRVVANNCAAHGFNHVFGYSLQGWLAFEVDALKHIASVFGCRRECSFDLQTGVKAFSTNMKFAFQCTLFHIIRSEFILFVFNFF